MSGRKALQRGGAALALPLLLVQALLFAVPVLAANSGGATLLGMEPTLPDAPPHADVTAMLLMARPEALDDVPRALGFPTTGAQVMLYGGGATFGKGLLRFGVQGLVGGLSARAAGMNTEWRLRLGNVIFEQRYLLGPVEATGGAMVSYLLTEGLLEDGNKVTRFDAQSYGSGVVAGARWPRGTQLGFFVRGGYLWLPVSGAWKGDLASTNPKAAFDLGGPIAQAQVELGF